MPIVLNEPYVYQPQGEVPIYYQFAEISAININWKDKWARFDVRYMNVDLEGNPEWCPLEPQRYVLRNTPSREENGVNPSTGNFENVTIPADPVFDTVDQRSVSTAIDELGRDIVAKSIYQWLIDEGHYQGSAL